MKSIAEILVQTTATMLAANYQRPKVEFDNENARTRDAAKTAMAIVASVYGEPCALKNQAYAPVADNPNAMGATCRSCGWPRSAHGVKR